MGILLTRADIAENAKWYFSDAYYTSDNRGCYIYSWPSPDFPHMCSIHADDMDWNDGNILRIRIRKWIESNISDTVIFDHLDKNYRKYYDIEKWDSYRDVKNGWYRFFFSDEHSHLAFSLAFADVIRPITDWSPLCPDDEEYLTKMKEGRNK